MVGRKKQTDEEKKVQAEKKKFCGIVGITMKNYPIEVKERIDLLNEKKEKCYSTINDIDKQLEVENKIYESQYLNDLKEIILKLSPEAKNEIKELIK